MAVIPGRFIDSSKQDRHAMSIRLSLRTRRQLEELADWHNVSFNLMIEHAINETYNKLFPSRPKL